MRREIRELFILTGMVLVIFLGSTIVMANHEDIVTSMKEEYNGPDVQEEGTTSAEEEEETSADQNEKDEKSVDSFTGLLIGLDADRGLTDVIMVGHFDAETNEVKIVSVPRDLHIDFREEPFKSIRSDINSRHKNPDTGKYEFILQTAYCKLGEVYYNLGKTEEAFYDVQTVIEEITGMKIDHMAIIDVSGFADVVDAVGGVEFYVPQDMHYSDPAQDLFIDLEEGLQVLDGEHAMEMVRFRKYRMGDLQRIQVQQDFIVELYRKFSTIRDLDRIVELVNTVYKIFQSDIGINFALEYAEYFFEIEPENLFDTENMTTIPSWGVFENERWYQYWDQEQAKEIVEELMNR